MLQSQSILPEFNFRAPRRYPARRLFVFDWEKAIEFPDENSIIDDVNLRFGPLTYDRIEERDLSLYCGSIPGEINLKRNKNTYKIRFPDSQNAIFHDESIVGIEKDGLRVYDIVKGKLDKYLYTNRQESFYHNNGSSHVISCGSLIFGGCWYQLIGIDMRNYSLYPCKIDDKDSFYNLTLAASSLIGMTPMTMNCHSSIFRHLNGKTEFFKFQEAIQYISAFCPTSSSAICGAYFGTMQIFDIKRQRNIYTGMERIFKAAYIDYSGIPAIISVKEDVNKCQKVKLEIIF